MSLEELLQVPVVVTASRQEEEATEAPATTVVITREEIRLRGYSFLKDALRDMPGMETQEYAESEFGTRVPVRGVTGNNKIIVLVDGMRVNPPGGEPMMLRSDISIRDAQQIEIVYGPGSTLYGQDAISAVINIITTRNREDNVHISRAEARDRLLKSLAPERRLANFGLELGYPFQKEVWGSLNLRFGEVRLYGSAHYIEKELTDLSRFAPDFWAQQEALAAGRGLPLDPKRYDAGLNLHFRIEYGQASLQLWHRQSARSSAEGIGLPASIGYVEPSRWADASTVVEAKFRLPIGQYFTLESVLTFNRFEVDPSSNYVLPYPAPGPGLPPTWKLDNYQYGRGISGALEERLFFRLAQRLHIVAGFFAAHYEVTPFSSVPGGADPNGSVPAQAGDITYYSTQGDASSLVNVPRVHPMAYQDFGGYVEANWRIFSLLRLVVGVRLDKNTSVDEYAFSPRAALIFNYRAFTAKYIIARAFVNPAPSFRYDIDQTATEIHGPNARLSPETALANELYLGFSHPHFNLGSSFYYNLQDNLFVSSGLPINYVQKVWLDPQGTQPVNLTQPANEGKSDTIGVDFSAKYNFWKLSGWASYSFTNFLATVNGVVVPMRDISAHNFRFGVSVAIRKNLHVTASLIARSTPANLTAPAALPSGPDVPWEINAHVLYSPIPALDLYADFRNLTNHAYYLAGDSGPYPAPGFQGSGGVRLAF
jgi:outer membrane receptor protein involved in Fe transport